MVKNATLLVQGVTIGMSKVGSEDYISLTDMIKAKDGDFFISDWIRNRNTLEFIGIWEELNNPSFNYGEFAIIKSQAGLNSYKVSIKELIEKANIICLLAKTGRYGGTFAHRDIAFEFGLWISPAFKLYMIKEFQRLKEQEAQQTSVEWQAKRELAKINYKIQTDAIQQNLLEGVDPNKHGFIYANEADMVNCVVFGMTHKQWKNKNPQLDGNQRDHASNTDLALVANLEATNGSLIDLGLSMQRRASSLTIAAEKLRKTFANHPTIKRMDREDSEQRAKIEKPKD